MAAIKSSWISEIEGHLGRKVRAGIRSEHCGRIQAWVGETAECSQEAPE